MSGDTSWPADRRSTFISFEQSIGLIRRVAERFYVLSKGTVAASGSLAEIEAEDFHKHIAI